MKICVYLSYVGLGTNLLHLSYCHQIAKKYGPVSIITICKNLEPALEDDPLIKEVIYLEKYYKKATDILKLSNFLKHYSFDKIFIFYPSLRIFLAAKIANIKKIYCYPILKKKNLHLIQAAKKFIEKNLKIKDCPTETNFVLSDKKKIETKEYFKNKNFNILIGAGSSGPTTKWGSSNFTKLINKLNETENYFFYILSGPNESVIAEEIIKNVNFKNCLSLSNKNISELLPFLTLCDLYIGNDSFGHHVTSQSGIPSIVLILDTPKAYSDYSKNHFRIVPDNIDLDTVKHGSELNPNSIKVEKVYQKILELKNLR